MDSSEFLKKLIFQDATPLLLTLGAVGYFFMRYLEKSIDRDVDHLENVDKPKSGMWD